MLIGLDIGTSAIKGVLLATDGAIVAKSRYSLSYDRPEQNHVTFDVEAWYQAVLQVIRELLHSRPAHGAVLAMSIVSASGNTVLLDQAGEPLGPAISWLDKRADGELERVLGPLPSEEVHQRVGWPCIEQFPLAQLAWYCVHQPEQLRHAARIGMSTDYINERLSGMWVMDSSTATTFYLQDQLQNRWHEPYLQALRISADKLPVLAPTGTELGTITPQAARAAGVEETTKIVLGSFDHPGSARGAGVFEEGQLLLSCGTSWVGFYPTRERQKAIDAGNLIDPFLQPQGHWGAMFSLTAVSAFIDHFICHFISDEEDRFERFSSLAAKLAPGEAGLLIDPLAEWTRHDTETYDKASKESIARALMEGTAFLLKRELGQLASRGVDIRSIVMVGGPSETHPWPQIVSDVLGIPLQTVNGSCAGAVGAALNAGVGAGVYKDIRSAYLQCDFPVFERVPDPHSHNMYTRLFDEFTQAYKRKAGVR